MILSRNNLLGRTERELLARLEYRVLWLGVTRYAKGIAIAVDACFGTDRLSFVACTPD